MKQIEKLENLICKGEINHEDIIHDSVGFVVNNAIDVDKFKYDEKIRKEKRKELNIKDNQLVIGHIGRFVQQKNHEFLIDIFNEIYKQDKNAILLLIGEGPLKEEIQNKVNELGLDKNVKFLGQRSDANELYQAMDAFVLPSLYEGLPVVGVEAQAAGLPCFFSTDMTKETEILDSTKFISLTHKSKYWADKILKEVSLFKRQDTSEEIVDNKFSIKVPNDVGEVLIAAIDNAGNIVTKRIQVAS